jgi:hypothetical protein
MTTQLTMVCFAGVVVDGGERWQVQSRGLTSSTCGTPIITHWDVAGVPMNYVLSIQSVA